MNIPDQDIVLTAVEDARRILREYIAPGPSDATRTVHRLIAVLDRDEVVHARSHETAPDPVARGMKAAPAIRNAPGPPTLENPRPGAWGMQPAGGLTQ
jgi:hypothetical protein